MGGRSITFSASIVLRWPIRCFLSGILQCVLFPSSALLGASGIVFMLIMLSSLAGSRNGGIQITLILVGALYLASRYMIFCSCKTM